MKRNLSWFMLLGLVAALPAGAATNIGTRAASSVDLTGAPGVRARENVNYQKYETRSSTQTYKANDGKNLYYTQPAKRSELYKQYTASQNSSTTSVRTTRSETLRGELKRKYFLAHPFFQPLKGNFGSVTDISYGWNSFDLTFSNIPDTATWKTSQFAIKEDFSYGITDRVSVLGMLRYDMTDYDLDWAASIDDSMDDNGLNMFGLGAQWRFVDNDKWIATASAYYQHQKDVSNNFILDIKGGYKVASSTIYGLARGWYVSLDQEIYGNGINGIDDTGNPAGIFVAYETNADNAFYIEGGIGMFSVLDEDWTLNLEGVFGTYDWHNQMTLRGAIGWQPNDWFALNLYAKTAVYDSADGKEKPVFMYNSTSAYQWVRNGSAKIDNYGETTVGLQAIFTF